MKRNEATTISKLQVGDRFYKQTDKSKESHQVMDPEIQIRTKSQHFFICPVVALDGNFVSQKTKPISGNIDVIYLRNVNETIQ